MGSKVTPEKAQAFRALIDHAISRPGMTVGRLAGHCSSSERIVQYWLHGQRTPPSTRIDGLLRALQTDIVLSLQDGTLLYIDVKRPPKSKERQDERTQGLRSEAQTVAWLCKRLGAERVVLQQHLPTAPAAGHPARSSKKKGP